MKSAKARGYPRNGSPKLRPEDLPGAQPAKVVPPSNSETSATSTGTSAATSSGTRRALCIGINHYPSAPLFGCVSDARRWNEWFTGAGFQTTLLTDHEATRDKILSSMRSLVSGSTAGDVVAIQYAGHGTQLPDLNGDEQHGDTPGLDEALVPVDFLQSGFVIDDDIAEISALIPDGVRVTCFFDCCHSGTGTRALMGRSGAPAADDARPRFLAATEEMLAINKKTRKGTRSLSRDPENHREILFAACKSHQVAWESNGQGDFTRNALEILATGAGSLTNADFLAKVNAAFGNSPRQNPDITCDTMFLSEILLARAADGSRQGSAKSNPEVQALLAEMRQLVDRFSK